MEITSECEEILDSLSEEEKESDTVNDAKDGFVTKVVQKEAKQIKADLKKKEVFSEDSYEMKIVKVEELFAEEKSLKSQVKSDEDKLHLLTKETIENLTDEQVYELLYLKWIVPIMSSLNKLPGEEINELTTKVQALSEKYAATCADIEKEIHETEGTLSSFIDDLTGDEYDMKGLSEFQSLLKGE